MPLPVPGIALDVASDTAIGFTTSLIDGAELFPHVTDDIHHLLHELVGLLNPLLVHTSLRLEFGPPRVVLCGCLFHAGADHRPAGADDLATALGGSAKQLGRVGELGPLDRAGTGIDAFDAVDTARDAHAHRHAAPDDLG